MDKCSAIREAAAPDCAKAYPGYETVGANLFARQVQANEFAPTHNVRHPRLSSPTPATPTSKEVGRKQ